MTSTLDGDSRANRPLLRNGAGATTCAPVLAAEGFKSEDDVDLVVQLPGRDFALRRVYTGSTMQGYPGFPWLLSDGWATSVEGWAKFAKHNPLAPDNNPFNDKVTITSFPIENATEFFAPTNGATTFDPVSPSPSQVRLAGDFWRYEAPGAGFTEYYRDDPDDPDDEEHEYLDGRIYRQVDENGNIWQYEYRAFAASTGVPSRPRLHRIYLNGTSLLNCAAYLEFEWVTGTLSFPGSGKMRSVTVFRPTKPRPDSSVVWVPTQYAKYTYKNDDPFTYGHLSSGANNLILVEAGQLVNAPAVGQSVSLNDLVYHRRFTHYRYAYGTGSGLEGMITHEFHAESIEYFARQWATANGSSGSTYSILSGNLTGAVEELLELELTDNNLPGFTDTSVTIEDLASKIIEYYDADDEDVAAGYPEGQLARKVKKQTIRAGCGCGSGNERIENYTYARRPIPETPVTSGTWTVYPIRWSSVTKIAESGSWGSRATYHWGEERTITNVIATYEHDSGTAQMFESLRVPYTVADMVIDGTTGLKRITYYEFDDTKHTKKRMYYPSAVSDVALDAVGLLDYSWTGSYPSGTIHDQIKGAFTFSSSGLVEEFDYDTDGRAVSRGIKNGASGQLITLEEWDYANPASFGGRADLVTEHRRLDGGAPALVTSFDYTLESTAIGGLHERVSEKRTQARRETEAQNGPPAGGSPVLVETEEVFENDGLLASSTTPDGVSTEHTYTVTLGQTTYPTYTGVPFTTTRTGGSLSLSSSRMTDLMGRPRAQTSEAGVTTYSTYSLEPLGVDEDGEFVTGSPTSLPYLVVTSLPHKISASEFSGPAVRVWADAAFNIWRSTSYEVDSMSPVGTRYVDSWTAGDETAHAFHSYGLAGELELSRRWHDVSLSATAGAYTDTFEYDGLGRLIRTTAHNGQITETDYDIHDRPVTVRSGTNAGNLLTLSQTFYDDPDLSDGDAEHGAGDGNATIVRTWIDATTYRDQVSIYDWRNRLRTAYTNDSNANSHLSPLQNAAYTATLYDDLDRGIELAEFGVPAAGGSFVGLTGDLADDDVTSLFDLEAVYGMRVASLTRNHYSDRGLLWASDSALDPENDTAGFLRAQSWFDDMGRVVVSLGPNGAAAKAKYDDMGRTDTTLVVDGQVARSGSSTFADIVGFGTLLDVVLEQSQTAYDSATGLPVLVTTSRRRHDESETTAGIGSSPVTTFVAMVYDDAARPIGQIDYGINQSQDVFQTGGTAPSAFSVPSSVPDRDTGGWVDTLITETHYDTIGRPYETGDAEGRITRTIFDDLNRTIAVIENLTGSAPAITKDGSGLWKVTHNSGSDPDENRVTSMVYDSADNVTHRIAHRRGGGTSDKRQITQYVYAVDDATSDTDVDPYNVADSNGLLLEIRYPDDSDGVPSNLQTDRVRFAYNRVGEQIALKDQNGTVREFDRDQLGRVTAERAIIPQGSDVDDSVLQLTTDYDELGRTLAVKSWGMLTNPPTGPPLNAVEYAYTPRGDIETLDQYHTAADYTGATPRTLTWTYEQSPSTSQNEYRLESLEYPDGSELLPIYGQWDGSPSTQVASTTSSHIDRIEQMWLKRPGASSAEELVTYDHLGASTVVSADLAAGPGVQSDRTADESGNRRFGSIQQTGAGVYPGWDRFGRLRLLTWAHEGWQEDGAGSPTFAQIAQHEFTYDRVTNRLTDTDLRLTSDAADRDWEYGYDPLNRLTTANRGVTGSFSTPAAGSRSWTLDALGNWDEVDTYDGSSWTNKDWSFNETNELLTLGSGGQSRAYDANGNLTGASGGGLPTRAYVYDAWNRLVRVEDGSGGVIGEYEYNGLHWRTLKRIDAELDPGAPNVVETRSFTYSPSWQLLEERADEGSDGSVDRLAINVWGKRSIDDSLFRSIDEGADGTYERSYFYVTDALYSVVAVIEDTAATTTHERLRYDAYGVPEHRYPEDYAVPYGVFDFSDTNAFLVAYGDGDLNGTGTLAADLSAGWGQLDFSDVTAFQAGFGTKQPVGLRISGPGGTDNPFGYTGAYYDPETGFWERRHRVYDPATARWLQRDPAGYVDGMSLYLYVRGNPFSFTDPLGLCGRASDSPYYDRLSQNDKQFVANNPNAMQYFEERERLESVLGNKDIVDRLKKNDPEQLAWLQNKLNALTVVTSTMVKIGDANPDAVMAEIVGAYSNMLSTAGDEISSAMDGFYGKGMIGGVVVSAGVGMTAAYLMGFADDAGGMFRAATGAGGDFDMEAAKNTFNYGKHVSGKMGPRGWTDNLVDEAISSGQQISAVNKATGNAATRYVHPRTGQSAVVDKVTNEVIHVGGPGFRYGPASGDLP